jgi:hypothetical protein
MDEIRLNESSNINDDYKKVFSPTSIVDDRKTKKASNMKKGTSKNKGN